MTGDTGCAPSGGAPSRAGLNRRGTRLRSFAVLVGALAVWLLAVGSAEATSPPENTALPVVSGTVGEGHTLTASTGTWSGAGTITYAYQWERCNSHGACTEIPSATSSSYVQVSGDTGKLLDVAVTATNEGGSTTAVSSGISAASWGQNDHGQLGAIYKDPYEELPIDVEGLTSIKAFAAAESFDLALLSNGTVASFGGDSNGQLGDDEYKANWEREVSHTMVKGLKEVTAVAAANEHGLALLKNGDVDAWGANEDGDLGRGVGGFEGESGVNSRIPNEVPGLKEKAKAIAAGGGSDYAVLDDGEVEAWGGNEEGQLGVEWKSECEKTNSKSEACKPYICKTGGGPQLCETSPEPVVYSAGHPIKEVLAVYAGAESAYALLESGKVISWGGNKDAALGQPSAKYGSGATFIAPAEVMREVGFGSYEALTHVTELAAGTHQVLAVVEGGEVLGWGDAEDGGLGELPGLHWTCSGKAPCLIAAVAIAGLEHVSAEAVAAGNKYSLVLSKGEVYAFGRDEYGELANGATSEEEPKPTVASALGSGVREISAGPTHAVALLTEPPAPHIVVTREHDAVRIAWFGEVPYHLNYQEFERPGLTEIGEEEGETGGEEGEGPLVDKTRPKIRHKPVSSSNLTYLGQTLEGTTGSWKGAELITFTYQWQRCKLPVEGECSNISGATGIEYKPTEADVGDFIRFVVTAKNAEVEEGVSVAAEITTVVKKEKGKETPLIQINIKKEEERGELTKPELVLPQKGESELAHVPYEFKLEFTGKARWFIATPGT
jgi:alpha-tubulin suppressor-like RCC1 family protein